MMLNVIKYDITITNLTWYQSQPEKESFYSRNNATTTTIEDQGFMLENPKILKLVVLVDLLYIEIGEASRDEMFTG